MQYSTQEALIHSINGAGKSIRCSPRLQCEHGLGTYRWSVLNSGLSLNTNLPISTNRWPTPKTVSRSVKADYIQWAGGRSRRTGSNKHIPPKCLTSVDKRSCCMFYTLKRVSPSKHTMRQSAWPWHSRLPEHWTWHVELGIQCYPRCYGSHVHAIFSHAFCGKSKAAFGLVWYKRE